MRLRWMHAAAAALALDLAGCAIQVPLRPAQPATTRSTGPALLVLSVASGRLVSTPLPGAVAVGAAPQSWPLPPACDATTPSVLAAADGSLYVVSCARGTGGATAAAREPEPPADDAPAVTTLVIDPRAPSSPQTLYAGVPEQPLCILPDRALVTAEPLPPDRPIDSPLGADPGFAPDGDPYHLRARPLDVGAPGGPSAPSELGDALMGERAVCASTDEVLIGVPGELDLGDAGADRGVELVAVGPLGARVIVRHFGFTTLEPIAADPAAPRAAYALGTLDPAAPPEAAYRLQVVLVDLDVSRGRLVTLLASDDAALDGILDGARLLLARAGAPFTWWRIPLDELPLPSFVSEAGTSDGPLILATDGSFGVPAPRLPGVPGTPRLLVPIPSH